MEQMIQRVIAKQIERIIRRKLTETINQAVESKVEQIAGEDSINWTGDFCAVVSGYYVGILMQYCMLPMIVFCLLCAMGCGIAEGLMGYSVLFMIMAVICSWCLWISKKRMVMLVYWDGGMLFMDRKGNILAQMPSEVLRQATIKKSKIKITWNEKDYVIVRNPKDNEEAVQEMLAYYGIE